MSRTLTQLAGHNVTAGGAQGDPPTTPPTQPGGQAERVFQLPEFLKREERERFKNKTKQNKKPSCFFSRREAIELEKEIK